MINKDSNAKPYIEQKDVILCRTGIQYYAASEVAGLITETNKPPKAKDWYREYRPASVVVAAQKLCSNLPVTKEHPSDWVTQDNFSELAGGVTGEHVEVVDLEDDEGNIGIKSNLTFYTKELYQYYQDNNKEVSLGYTCRKHFVDNPDEVGYDIILDEITEVNHLAITRSGRGGANVAVIDSLIGGMKPMRTGIFAWLKSKKQKDSAPTSFGKEVFDALKNSKGTTAEELEAEMKGVFDSCSQLKDCEQKNLLMDTVRDCFDHKEESLANEEDLTQAMDSMYVSISGDSLKEIVDACSGMGKASIVVDTSNTDSKDEPKEDKADDSKEEPKEDKADDSKEDKSKEEKEDKTDDACGKKDTKDSFNKDSVEAMIKDSIEKVLKENLKPMVTEMVADTLGVQKDSTIEGSNMDSSAYDGALLDSEYASFLN